MMSIADYLRLVATKLEEAEGRQDRPEVVRLLVLLRDTCNEKIVELQK